MGLSKDRREVLQRVKVLFQDRPIWSAAEVAEKLSPQPAPADLELVMPRLAFIFRNGEHTIDSLALEYACHGAEKYAVLHHNRFIHAGPLCCDSLSWYRWCPKSVSACNAAQITCIDML